MKNLTGADRKYLKRLAHHLEPTVFIGRAGLTDSVTEAVNVALEANELVKVKFLEHKDEKHELSEAIATRTRSQVVGLVGHIATFFRYQEDDEKRSITLPAR